MFSSSRNAIEFVLNGKPVQFTAKNCDPTQTLNEFLRSDAVHLTGTKRGCEEGGCGSCTVLMSYKDPITKRIRHKPIDSCMVPVGSCHHTAITTIEGIGSSTSSITPIQKAFIEHHGTQCGYCTPGFIMNAFALLLENPFPTTKQIEAHFDGNLCRCTGYRGIFEALREFACDGKPNDDLIKCSIPANVGSTWNRRDIEEQVEKFEANDVAMEGENFEFFLPSTWEGVLEAKRKHPDAVIIGGNTDVVFEKRKKLISLANISGLRFIEFKNGNVVIGAATPIASILEFCRAYEDERTLSALGRKLENFACNQVRSVATIVGNLVRSGDVNDTPNFVLAAEGTLVVADAVTGEERLVKMENLSVARKQTTLKPTEVVKELVIPLTKPSEHVFTYRMSMRKSNDLSFVSASFKVGINDRNIIEKMRIAYNGLSVVGRRAFSAEKMLVGKEFTLENMTKAFQFIDQDFPLDSKTRRGMIEYKRELSHNFLLKFFHQTERERGRPYDRNFAEDMTEDAHRMSVYHQCAKDKTKMVGKSVHHSTGLEQTTGEANYTDDLELPQQTVHIALVRSTVPHGKIKRIDFSKCRNLVAHYVASDIGSDVNWVTGGKDEEMIASKEVVYMGQPIALVIANSEEEAWNAASNVIVEYEELPSIMSIQEAMQQNSVLKSPVGIHTGNFETEYQRAPFKAEGTVDIGSQFHFYMETCAALATKGERGKIKINATSKNLEQLQSDISRVLKIPIHAVETAVTRIGGSFCGKNTRMIPVGVICAFVANKLNRPAKIRLPRNVDTELESGDNNFTVKYRVGFDKDGRITALHIDNYVDSGWSYARSNSICSKAMLHGDSVYNIPNFNLNYFFCKTNKISGAPFRGFGCQFAHVAIEAVLEKVAQDLGLPPEDVKRRNFYKAGDKTPYQVVLDDVRISEVWDILDDAEFAKQKQEVEQFNATHTTKKRGIAITPMKFGVGRPKASDRKAGALVHIFKDGTVSVAHSGIEVGQGLHTKMCQIVSDVLDIPFEKVRIDFSNISLVANGAGTGSGYATDLNGFAVKDAAEQLAKRLKPYRTGVSWEEAARKAFNDCVDMSAHGWYHPDDSGFDFTTNTGRPYAYYEYGGAIAVVEIDTLTGTHKVLSVKIVFDVGRSLNPALDIGQIEGGYMQGYGWMTKERPIIIDNSCQWANPGANLTSGFATYKIPQLSDLPSNFHVTLLPNSTQSPGVLSAKGAGEPPLILANAVGFAIAHALRSARIANSLPPDFPLQFPLTPERIVRIASGV